MSEATSSMPSLFRTPRLWWAAPFAALAVLAAFGLGRASARAAASGSVAPPVSAPAAPNATPKDDLPELVPADVAGRLTIKTEAVARRPLARRLELPGRVAFDQDRLAIVGPRLAGRVVKLTAHPGEAVRAGQVLAEIESVELARAAAEYIGLKARALAAQRNAAREAELADKRVSSARERELAQSEAAALAAQARAAEQLLLALGLSRDELPDEKTERPLSRFRLRAPLDGVVVERGAVPGQAVDASHAVYRLANLEHLWVELSVYERDLAWVKPALEAELVLDVSRDVRLKGRVQHIEPGVDPQTRAATVHLEVENPGGKLMPGQFVTAHLAAPGEGGAALVVPRAAVQSIEGKSYVFVHQQDGAYKLRPVQVASLGGDEAEVQKGLDVGEQVAVDGAFLLKSEVLR